MDKLLLITICVIALFALGMPFAAAKGEVNPSPVRFEKATFAGGCFWCMESPFDKLAGVISTTSGYTGGAVKNPTYEDVSAGVTEHAEAVQVLYDPTKIDFADLLTIFWQNINPTQPNGQFADIGRQYRTVIFYHNDSQRQAAEASKEKLQKSSLFARGIVTEIVPATEFYAAEEYHQDYYRKNPLRYKFYRRGSGRDQYLEDVWGNKTSKIK